MAVVFQILYKLMFSRRNVRKLLFLGIKAPFALPVLHQMVGSNSERTPRAAHVWVFILTFPEVFSLYRFMITALSLSIEIITLLLEELNHDRSSSLLVLRPGLVSPLSSDFSQEEKDDDSRPAADRLGVGCVAGGRE